MFIQMLLAQWEIYRALPVKIRKATFSGCYKNLNQIDAFVRQASEEAGFDCATQYLVETACDEACSNIIEHAYGGEGKGEIECTCRISDEGLTLTFRDFGKPFDPSEVPTPKVHAPIEEREGHGLGMFFMYSWMDEVKFEFNSTTGNLLTMVKRKDSNKKYEDTPPGC
jgi:serine/threonine-protein kinase RsbW